VVVSPTSASPLARNSLLGSSTTPPSATTSPPATSPLLPLNYCLTPCALESHLIPTMRVNFWWPSTQQFLLAAHPSPLITFGFCCVLHNYTSVLEAAKLDPFPIFRRQSSHGLQGTSLPTAQSKFTRGAGCSHHGPRTFQLPCRLPRHGHELHIKSFPDPQPLTHSPPHSV
jgi:hypothetical protein